MTATLRCGIVGPGRTRDGLGPFLARFLEAAGIAVVGGVGRDLQRTAEACASLAAEFRHPVAAFDSVARLLDALAPDALVIASPAAAHREALELAASAGVHVLCEKPFVRARETEVVDGLLDRFAARGRVVVENCQWPYVLPAFERLHPGVGDAGLREVRFRLSPSGRGRAMLEDSLSHLISLLQALVRVDRNSRIESVRIHGAAEACTACEVDFALCGGFGRLRAVLELRQVVTQPRSAWLEIDGHRAERRIRSEDYALSFVSPDGRSVEVEDPMRALVYGFATLSREPDVERIRAESERVRQRARLYREVLEHWSI